MRIFTLVVMAFCINAAGVAQTTDTDDKIAINVSATVISTVELVTIQSIRVSQANAVDGRVNINPLNSSNAGKMIASGTPNSKIRISYLESRELTQPDNPQSLQFHYRIAVNNQDDQSSAERLDLDSRDFEFNSEGDLYLWNRGIAAQQESLSAKKYAPFQMDLSTPMKFPPAHIICTSIAANSNF